MKNEIIYGHCFATSLQNMPIRRLKQSGGAEIERNLSSSGLCWSCWFVGWKHYTIKKNTEALWSASKEISPRSQWRENYAYVHDSSIECRKSHRIKIGGRDEIFGIILINQNGFHEEIKVTLISGNVCYRLVGIVLSSRFLWKNTKINIYVLIYLLTYSREQSPLKEANRFSASQEISRILWNPKVYYRVYLSLYWAWYR